MKDFIKTFCATNPRYSDLSQEELIAFAIACDQLGIENVPAEITEKEFIKLSTILFSMNDAEEEAEVTDESTSEHVVTEEEYLQQLAERAIAEQAENEAAVIAEESINKTENKEDNIMSENKKMNNATVTAESIVGAAKNMGKDAMKTVLLLCNDVKKEAQTISALSQQEAELHIKKKFANRADKFIDWLLNKLNVEVEGHEKGDSWFAPIGEEPKESVNTSLLKKAIADFKAIKNSGEKKGWKKAWDVLKAVFGILFGLFIQVAKVVLKLAFTLVVATIQIGCVSVMALASCFGVAKNDVVKPMYKAGKKAWTNHKGKTYTVDDAYSDEPYYSFFEYDEDDFEDEE